MEKNTTTTILHPFNETSINDLLDNSPNFANGHKPDELTIYQKKQVYEQIKQMNHEQSNRVYNLFFEAIVTKLN